MTLENRSNFGGYNFETATVDCRVSSAAQPNEALSIDARQIRGSNPAIALQHLPRSHMQNSRLVWRKLCTALTLNNTQLNPLVGTAHTTDLARAELSL